MSKPTPMNSYAQEFKNIIEGFRHNRNIREVFTDWLAITAYAVHQEPYHLGLLQRDDEFDQVEAQYLAAVKKYTREELESFGHLLGLTRMALGEEKADFLGQLYMDLEISQARSGEFFTHFPVSLMLAKMLLSDASRQIEEKGCITVAEPACGGGGMVIAAAKALEEAGYDPTEVLFFDATDISQPCCDMAYIQTALLDLSGIVRHGDTLRNQRWSSRFTPICRVHPARTNAFIDSLMPDTAERVKTDESALTPSQKEYPAQQQVLEFNLSAEALSQEPLQQPEPPQKQQQKPQAAKVEAINKLAQETAPPAYVQSSLF